VLRHDILVETLMVSRDKFSCGPVEGEQLADDLIDASLLVQTSNGVDCFVT